MTKDEIMAMEPGPEIEMLIAEHVLKWRKVAGPKTDYDGPCEQYDVLVPPSVDNPFSVYPPRGSIKPWYFCMQWSRNFREAWEVFEKITDGGIVRRMPDGKYYCSFAGGELISAETAPLAICKAALLAVREAQG